VVSAGASWRWWSRREFVKKAATIEVTEQGGPTIPSTKRRKGF